MDWQSGYATRGFESYVESHYEPPVNPQDILEGLDTSSHDTDMDLDMDLDLMGPMDIQMHSSHYMRDVVNLESAASAAAEGVDQDRPDCFFKFLEEEFRNGTLSSELYQRSVYKTVDFPDVVTPAVLQEHSILDKQGLEWGTLFESRRGSFRGSFLIPDGVCESVASHKSLVRRLRNQRYAAFRPQPSAFTLSGSEYSLMAFQRFFTVPKPHLFHFQLRNLLYPVSSTQVFYNTSAHDEFRVDMINPETGEQTVAIDPDMCDPALASLRVSALAANREVVMLGSTEGTFVVKSLRESADTPEHSILPSGMLTSSPNVSLNYISLLSTSAFVAGNDNVLRTLDLNTLKSSHNVTLNYAANASAFKPGSEDICVLSCDSHDSHIYDIRTGKLQMSLQGHTDFGFACAWSPDGKTVATGNQDGTCRIYDIRGTSNQCIGAVSGKLHAAIRSVDFDASGRYLALGEPVDYVTVIDTLSNCAARQTIEFFGGTAGVKFTQSSSAGEYQQLTIGVADETVGGIVQYVRPSQRQGEDFGFI